MSTTVIPIIDGVTVVETGVSSTVLLSNSVVNISAQEVDLSNFYTKTEADTLLAAKAPLVHTHVVNDITDFTTSLINGGSF